MNNWNQPNIVVSLIDIARYDTFGVDEQFSPSPYLKRLATESAFFPNATAVDTYTPTSHAAYFTGRDAIYDRFKGPQKPYYGLADHLSYNGYETLLMADNPYLSGLYSYFSGFERVQTLKDHTAIDDPRALALRAVEDGPHDFGAPTERNVEANLPGWDQIFKRYGATGPEELEWENVEPYLDATDYIAWRYQDLFRNIETSEGRPLYLFANIMGYIFWIRHKAEMVEWWASFISKNFGVTPDKKELDLLSRYFEDSGLFVRDAQGHIPVTFGKILKSLYVAFSAAIHDRLMTALKGYGVINSESVSLLSVDHGHMWREHGERFLEHGPTNNVYQPMLKIPFFLESPFLKPGRYENPITLLDLFPTLNRWVSSFAPVDESHFNSFYAAPLEQRIAEEAPLVFQTEAGSVAVIDGDLKIIFNQRVMKRSLAFHRHLDPGEEHNLYNKLGIDKIENARRIVSSYYRQESDCLGSLASAVQGKEFVGMSDETEAALRALGYLE